MVEARQKTKIVLKLPYQGMLNLWRSDISQGPKKNASIFQEEGSTPAPLTPPVIRVVLLHK